MKNARRNFFLVFFFFLPSNCLNALAEPITYLWTTTANITFAGKSSNNVPVTIALYADTGDVQADPNGGYEVSGTTVVKIDAIGYARFLVERRIFANSTALGLEGMFALTAPSYYSNYDLQSSMPRQNFAGNGFVTSGGFTAETTAGSVSIGPLSQLAFQAILSTHDSPSLSTIISPISVIEGGSATVSAAIAGAPPFWIQWRKDGADIPYAFGTNLTLTNMLVSDSGDYDVVITNIFGDFTSEKFAIVVNPSRPVITLQPVSQGGVLGSTIYFDAQAIGTPPLSWQWHFEDQPLSGANSNRLARTNVDISMFGSYWVTISNSLGMAKSDVVKLDRSSVIAWGLSPGRLPFASTNVISLTGGDLHFLALRSSGKVEAWMAAGGPGIAGSSQGQALVPSGLSNVVSIAAGSTHSLGAQGDGHLSMWGKTLSGVSDIPPAARENILMVGLGVGAQHVLALKSDGTVVDWGGESAFLAPLKVIPPNATNIVSVAAGAYHALALRADGRVLAWGNNQSRQTNVPASATGVVAIATAWHTSMALRADGRIVTWGANSQSFSATDHVDIAGGATHLMALRRNGQVLCKGSSDYGLAVVPAAATNAAGLAAGSYTAFAFMGDGPPVFNTVAANRFVDIGQNSYFRMWAIGAQPIAYQWSFNGTPLEGETNSWLTVTNVQSANAGLYTVIASNSSGFVSSKPMGLNTNPSASGQISLDGVQMAESSIHINFTGSATALYQLEFKNDLSEPDWHFLKNIDSGGSVASDIDVIFTNAQRFYRIRTR